MVRQEAMLGSPCQEPLLLDDIVSWHKHDSDFGESAFGSFYRPEKPLHQEVHSGSQIPILSEFEDNPLKRVKNFAFACGKIEDLPSLFCSLSFNPLRQPANYAESRYGGKCQDKR